VLVDGTKVGSIARGQTLRFEVSAGLHHLQLKSARRSSRPTTVMVEPGEAACCTCSPGRDASWGLSTVIHGRGRYITLEQRPEPIARANPPVAGGPLASHTDDIVACQLITILNDPDAPEGDQLDAAMDLEFHSGPWLEQEIFKILRRERFVSVLAQLCAESLAEIWARDGRIDPDFYRELRGPALNEVLGILGARAPHLIPPRGEET
jgi:hypothetical protein